MFNNLKKINELEKENKELRKELDIKTQYIERMRKVFNECEKLKIEWHEAIKEARIAKNNFDEIYREFLKRTRHD